MLYHAHGNYIFAMYYYLEGTRNTMTSIFIESLHVQPSESTRWLLQFIVGSLSNADGDG